MTRGYVKEMGVAHLDHQARLEQRRTEIAAKRADLDRRWRELEVKDKQLDNAIGAFAIAFAFSLVGTPVLILLAIWLWR